MISIENQSNEPVLVKRQVIMSSNFDPYQTPSTSLGTMSGGQAMSSFGVDNDTDGDDSDSKNSQSYKERR